MGDTPVNFLNVFRNESEKLWHNKQPFEIWNSMDGEL